MNKYYITTPIYYASGNPHIGHAFTTILADTFASYKRKLNNDVIFLTGMDEHGQKIADKASSVKMQPQEYVDSICLKFKSLWTKLNINYDFFIRTTNPSHCSVIKDVFSNLFKNDDVYLDKWDGLYCPQCEENYNKTSAIEKDGELYCKVGHKLVKKSEESYFLKLSKYQKWLEEFFENNPKLVSPSNRLKELINNFVKPGIEDLSITRTSINWGVPTNENSKHVIYVWIDALMSYLTGIGYGLKDDKIYQQFWSNKNSCRIHVIGKEITRFHCIYWPIMLKSLGLELPTKIVSHGWIVTKEGKMSKSLGNVVDPNEYIEKYGADALRYYLLKNVPIDNDGIYSHDLFIETFNADLANNFGNYISRTLGMINKYANGVIPQCNKNIFNKLDNKIINLTNDLIDSVDNYVNDFKFNDLIEKILNLCSAANKYIESNKPWTFKVDSDEMKVFLNVVSYVARTLIFILSPILKNGMKIAQSLYNFSDAEIDFNELKNIDSLSNHKVNTAKPIYLRII